MNRRNFIGTVAVTSVTALAGCGGSNSTESEQQSQQSIEDFVNLVDHHFERPPVGSSGVDLYFTIENISDEELSRVEFDGQLFVENERVGDTITTISDLGPGIQQEGEMLFTDATRINEITNYTITVRLPRKDRIEKTYEFDEFEISE